MSVVAALMLGLLSGQAQLTKLPQLTQLVEAPYPEDALAEGREAAVLLQLDVSATGTVTQVVVLESAGPAFDSAAVGAAERFIFTPAEAGELGPVPVRIRYRYGFVLKTVVKTSTRAPAALRLPVNFLGAIKESGTRKPIPYASVELSIANTATVTRTSTEADESGRFAFRGVPAGNHVVTVRAPFYVRFDTKDEVVEGQATEVLYYVDRAARDPYEVVVRAKIPKKEVARRTLTFEEIERLPGTQGDAIRVIQNLPGVARAPFGLGLLIVRGAPPQDTGVFLDGHRLPILFHFGGVGGFTSVVNARMLESIDFYPGGFGPEQGRISAGMVDLKTKYAATDRVHGEAVVDVNGASMFLEGPVTDDPADGAFTLGVRRSYIDGVLAAVLSAADSSVSLAPRYWDYQARYDRPLGDRRRMLSVLWYGSDDELLLLGGSGSGQGTPDGTQSRTYFHRFNPRFTYQPDADTLLRISPIVGLDYTNTESTGDPSGNTLRFLLKTWTAGLRVDGSVRLSPWAKLNAGGDLLWFSFQTDSELPAFPEVKDFPSPIATDRPTRRDRATVPAVLTSLYAELELQPTSRLTLWPGVRLDLYDFHAEAETLIDPRLVEGRTFLGVDPRVTARYVLTDEVVLKGQAGLFGQPAQPTQLYLNAELPLISAQQYSGGFEWQIVPRLSLDLVGFMRYQTDVPRFTGDTEVVDGEVRIVGFEPVGLRRAYGVEALLKLEKRWGLFGFIAYTFSRSEQRRKFEPWQTSIFFDQTHNLTIAASYELALSWFLGARFRYVTGGGLPGTQARWYDADSDQYDRELSDLQRRAPAFHQLDVRLDKRFTFDEWYLEAYVDVQNVYNRKNTEIYAPTFDFKSDVPIPSLPIFPVFGVKGVF